MLPMKRLLLLLLLATPLAAQDTSLRDLLRDALYTEEVTRDPATAATQYEDLLARFRDQRALAATALFRLAEVRRKQDRKEEAITLYQRLLTEFPEAGAEGKLARKNLATLGAKTPAPGEAVSDEESLELARITKLAETSPDLLKNPKLLGDAARKNQLRVIRFLLDRGANPNAIIAVIDSSAPPNSPLLEASARGHLSACKLLLEAGADPNLDLDPAGTHDRRALYLAVSSGHLQVVRLLLKHGADTEFAHSRWGTGTALVESIRRRHWSIAADLLESGADPNTPGLAFYPLHMAAHHGNPEWVKRLLKAGANPKATATRPKNWPDSNNREIQTGATPILLAIDSGSADCVRLLLAADKDSSHGPALRRAVEQNSLELVTLLLDSGVDPNALGRDGKPALTAALGPDDAEILRLLLDRGADPNLPFGEVWISLGPGSGNPFVEQSDSERIEILNSPLLETTRSGPRLSATQSLLAAGARPNPVALSSMIHAVAHADEDGSVVAKLLEFRPDHFNPKELPPMAQWKPAARRVFLEQVVYPVISENPEIAFLFLHSGHLQPLARQADSSKTPALARLMLDNFVLVTLPTYAKATQWSDFYLIRADESGEWVESAIKLAGDAPFPDLQWGDIIIAEPTEEGQPGYLDGKDASLRYRWAFRKRVSFPITVEIDGKAREINLKGGLLVYDPTRDEAPWLDAGQLTALLAPSHEHRPDASVKRSGWEDIRLISDNETLTRHLPLQAGDRLVIKTRDTLEKRGKRSVLTVPGLHVSRAFGQTHFFKIIAPTHPTLIQAIVDTYAPWRKDLTASVAELSEPTLATLSDQQSANRLAIPSIPGHPDFSRIRIRRLEEDGTESILEVDLAAAIASCDDATPPPEARAADIPLRPGDIVELPLHQDRFDQVWGGFSKDETRFFRKALGGRVLYFEPDQEPRPIELSWQPPRWRREPAGLLPLAPDTGAATMRVSEFLDAIPEVELDRDGNRSQKGSSNSIFLRDGDQVHPRGFFLTPRVRRVPTPPKR